MAPGKQLAFGAAALGAFALLGQEAAFTLPPAGRPGALRGSQRGAQQMSAPALEDQKAAMKYAVPQQQPQEAVASSEEGMSGFMRTALAVLAALAVAIAPMADAQAARSGGRMGGGGMRMGGGFSRMGGASRRVAPPPRTSSRTNTNLNIGVGVAPPIYAPSPFGFGYGGFGMPFAPPLFGPSIHLGGGSRAADQQLQNQQQQDERVIDQQKSQIEQMQKEIAELKTKQK